MERGCSLLISIIVVLCGYGLVQTGVGCMVKNYDALHDFFIYKWGVGLMSAAVMPYCLGIFLLIFGSSTIYVGVTWQRFISMQ